ncbi:hypothetical protein LQV05_001247 [Cryptococcus neoformans]|nr:hypothetical protein LQV05_003344 [Cryptococcus neoformans]UOH84446.1 hypothetical protein LQV05_001247 [Cryptococcus neoformans]
MAGAKEVVEALVSAEQQLLLARSTPREEKWAARVETMNESFQRYQKNLARSLDLEDAIGRYLRDAWRQEIDVPAQSPSPATTVKSRQLPLASCSVVTSGAGMPPNEDDAFKKRRNF